MSVRAGVPWHTGRVYFCASPLPSSPKQRAPGAWDRPTLVLTTSSTQEAASGTKRNAKRGGSWRMSTAEPQRWHHPWQHAALLQES